MSANKTTLGENIRAQMHSGDLVRESFLEQRPPLRFKQGLVGDPVRNSLLADGRVPSFSESSCSSSLAAGDLDGAQQRDDVNRKVRFIHEHRKYTRILVSVNKDDCLTPDKTPCNVVCMSTTKRKTQPAAAPKPRPKRVKQLDKGPDGKTFPQRLSATMADQGIGQTALAKRCSELYSSFYPAGPDDKVKQQHVFNALGGQSTSEYLPLMAVVLDVNDLWLQFGVGPKVRGT